MRQPGPCSHKAESLAGDPSWRCLWWCYLGSGEAGNEGWRESLGLAHFTQMLNTLLVTTLLLVCLPPPIWIMSTVYICVNL